MKRKRKDEPQTQEEWEDENLPGWIVEQLGRGDDDEEGDDETEH